jgi:Mg2+-importing ATPase
VIFPSLPIQWVGAGAAAIVAILGALCFWWWEWWGLAVFVPLISVFGWWLARALGKALVSKVADPPDSATVATKYLQNHPVREIREWARQRAELEARMERLLASQRDFTANAAHELRTPLAALRVAGECALRARDPVDLRETICAMLEETERVDRLVGQLLALSRAESGQMPVDAQAFPVGRLIGPVVEWLGPVANAAGKEIHLDLDERSVVWVDANLFRIALENLIANAIRYAPEGTVITLRARHLESGGVAIEVLDEGPGVEIGEEDKIFERFYRGRGASAGGAGLGLPMAKWAVEAFGGKLEYERRLGRGSAFRILCPETEWDHFDSGPPASPAEIEADWVAHASPAQLLGRLGSRLAGLDPSEAARRLEAIGPNALRSKPILSGARHLWQSIRTPFNAVLSVSILLSILLGEHGPAVVMSTMIALSSALRFWQERRAQGAVVSLAGSVALWAKVSRPKVQAPVRVPVEHLVPGDIVHLAPGDMVPADMRLLTAHGLQVSETTFTGESFPVIKTAAAPADDSASQSNLCFLGSHVTTGGGVGVVYATGARTRLGGLVKRREQVRKPSLFDRDVQRVSWCLLGFMAVLLPIVFLINGVLKGDWTEALLFGLAAAIGLTPELLPMIVNVNLARAATSLSRRGVLIKSLPAVQELGSMNVLCVDKTGTLTEDQPRLTAATNWNGALSKETLQTAAVNAHFQRSARGPLDEIILLEIAKQGLPAVEPGWKCLREIPFDHERRRVSILVLPGHGEHAILYTKGAAELLLPLCTSYLAADGSEVPFDEPARKKTDAQLALLQKDGGRVLAVAKRTLLEAMRSQEAPEIEKELTFVGFLAFDDPVKDGSAAAIAGLRSYGIDLKLLSGDHPDTTLAVARSTGFRSAEAITGAEVDHLGDKELRELIKKHDVFARLSPAQKARIVSILRNEEAERGGQTRVGFLGDGANDANALREADVRIATKTAADLCKECADVILTEKDLGVLLAAVDEGRTAFGNILKYVQITASSNFGNALSVVLASVSLPFLPIRAVQLLLQNLLYDIAQFLLPWDRVDADFRSQPRAWSPRWIVRFMLVFGPLSCVFDLLTFGVLWWGFGARSVDQAALFHTGWFTVGLLSQLLIVHILRTRHLPFFDDLATARVIIATVLAAATGLALPYMPWAADLGFTVLPFSFFLWVLLILVAYALSAQWAKLIYIRRTTRWF